MGHQHEERIFVPKDLASARGETSTQPLAKRERPRKPSPHEVNGTSKAANNLGRPRGHMNKFAAKRTSRNRLIASLQRAHGAPGSVQPAKAASIELPVAGPPAVVSEELKGDDTTTGFRLTVEISSDSPAPSQEPEGACRNGARATLSQTRGLKPSQKLPFEPGFAEPKDVGATKDTPRRTRDFDSAAFDAAIYKQPGAMNPPHGMSLTNQRQQKSAHASEDERMYIHANPAVHLSHNRSEEWHQQKAREIQARGRRKAWFGRVIERQRWLRAREVAQKRQANGNESAYRLVSPQPWTYRRPLDFGDVEESHLPDDVLGDPGWLKACAWHREVRHMKTLRRRLALRSAQETRQFFRDVVGGTPLNHDS
ncbi:hypothetical protein OCS_05147 [Ophiocordyceps sinensis CO18]|uniref:Uncharacterized protein n=1 Tax=Ophiocordyceps sinensis (strain Co18 / CGMCC 3.14243) TaxID=911162 RepID=T5A998_OPHSC|nr:hypothetical protein OCS_05147 [Ophiocordyceps sinensis CO18]